jgi:hypothetical protein
MAFLAILFLRNFDDVIALKGLKGYDWRNVENIMDQGCVLWCDWGRALEIGAETCADEFRNIIFSDCDIIHTSHTAIDLQNGDRGILFEDMRVEYNKYAIPYLFLESDDEGLPQPQIVLSGFRRDHMTKDIMIDNYYVNGVKINTVQDANIVMNEFTENIKVI